MKRIGTAAAAAAILVLASSALASGGGLRHTIRFDNPWVPAGAPGNRHLEIEVDVPGGELLDGPRPPLNLVLVMDRSGSMAEAGKLDYVRQAARDIVRRLDGRDTFALVVFDDWARVVIPPTYAGDPERFEGAIHGIGPGGSTNLSGGLQLGYDQARRYWRSGAVNRVFLLTDGLANRGVTDPGSLARMAAAEAERGVVLSAFGVGRDFNEDLLAMMADAGRGSYWYIASPRQIPDMLSREFGAAQHAACLDVTITIELEPGCRLDHVYGYPWKQEGRRAFIHLGDLPGGARKKIIARLEHQAATRGSIEVGEIGIGWKRAGDGREERRKEKAALKVTADVSQVKAGRDDQVATNAAVAAADEEMAGAARAVDKGDYREAEEALRRARKTLEASPVKDASVADRARMVQSYGRTVSAAPSMPADQLKEEQKKAKFEVYQKQRQAE